MNKEDKVLLLRDLCARLPYGVICTDNRHGASKATEIDIESGVIYLFDVDEYVSVEVCRPYLRPMSSMAEKEKEELKGICSIYIPTYSKNIGFEDYGILVFTHHLTDNSYSFKLNLNVIDWLNAHHFDYRGLIEKGLALEAPEGMYKTE